MHYTHAFFDLDGTLIDSSPGITHSVQYALEHSGITPPAEEELTCFIGPPLLDSFCRYFDMTREAGGAPWSFTVKITARAVCWNVAFTTGSFRFWKH